jgi:hypothetical protein
MSPHQFLPETRVEEAVDILQLDKEVPSKEPAFMAKIKALIELPSEILSLLKNKMISTVAPISENSMVTPLNPSEERRRQAIAKFYNARFAHFEIAFQELEVQFQELEV